MLSLPRACFVGLLRAFVGLLHVVGGRPVELEFFRDDTETVQPCWIYAVASDTALPSNSPCTGTATPGNLIDMQYNFSLGSGDNGNVLGITNNRVPNRSQNFTYDQLNRVLTAQTTSDGTIDQVNCWSEGYVYDDAQAGTGPWGNLIQINPGPSAYTGCTQESGFSYTVNSNNQISGWCYDASGNLLAESAPPCADTPTYSYNAENQLTSTAGVTYEYDGDGNRVSKSSGILYWYGGGNNPIAETDASGNTINEYIFFSGKRIAREDAAGNIVYYVADHLGTSRIISDASGTILDDSDFYPFGGERPAMTPTSGSNYKFTGKERDTESGLDELMFRYFASSTGRFMSPDPFGAQASNPQTLNKYAYVVNNPLRFVDPTGLWHCSWSDNEDGSSGGEDDSPDNGGASHEECMADPGASWQSDPGDAFDGSACTYGCGGSTSPLPDIQGEDPPQLGTTSGVQTLTGGSGGGDDSFQPGTLAYGVFGPPSYHTWNGANNFVNIATAVAAAGPALAYGAVAVPTAGAYAVGWGSAALGSAGGFAVGLYPTYLDAAAENGLGAYDIKPALYQFFQATGNDWTANAAYLDMQVFLDRQAYLAGPAVVSSDSTLSLELQHLNDLGVQARDWILLQVPY